MEHRRRLTKRSPLLLIALVAWWGCAPQADRGAASLTSTARVPATGIAPAQHGAEQHSDPRGAEDRVRELEQQLAERDRQIAAVRVAIATGRGHPEAVQGAPDTVQPPAPAQQPAAPPPSRPEPAAAPPDVQHPPEAPAAPSAAASDGSEGSRGQGAKDQPPSNPRPLDPPATNAAADRQLANAQKRIAGLEKQLALEVKRRQDVEAEMTRLLQETSAGPFEHADNVVEKHLREELVRARKEIGDLRTSLTSERREREDLERRYTALQTQVQASADAPARDAASSEEVNALKERQRRVLASIQQELQASKQREAELRQSIDQSQGTDGVSVADEVTNLRSANSALQMRLDDEHQRNRDLSAKLQLATRVTDLIFKMQSAGVQSARPIAVPLPAVAAP